MAEHPLGAAAALHLAPSSQQRKILHKALHRSHSSRLRLLRFELTEKADSQLYELWPGHGNLAASDLEREDTMEVCMRHIEAGGGDQRVWRQLRNLLKNGTLYEFQHWHWHFFNENRVAEALRPLAAEVMALVKPQLPAPAQFSRKS